MSFMFFLERVLPVQLPELRVWKVNSSWHYFFLNRLCDFHCFLSIELFRSHNPSRKFIKITKINSTLITEVTNLSCQLRLTRIDIFKKKNRLYDFHCFFPIKLSRSHNLDHKYIKTTHIDSTLIAGITNLSH
jgi:hypothetical protein